MVCGLPWRVQRRRRVGGRTVVSALGVPSLCLARTPEEGPCGRGTGRAPPQCRGRVRCDRGYGERALAVPDQPPGEGHARAGRPAELWPPTGARPAAGGGRLAGRGGGRGTTSARV